VTAPVHEIVIVREIDGSLRCESDSPPAHVAFSAVTVELLRRAGSTWARIDGDTITMHVKPEPLRYRLTGDVDLTDGLVAVRVTAGGEVWPGADADR